MTQGNTYTPPPKEKLKNSKLRLLFIDVNNSVYYSSLSVLRFLKQFYVECKAWKNVKVSRDSSTFLLFSI